MPILRDLLAKDPAAALREAGMMALSRENPAGETAYIAGAASYALGREKAAEDWLCSALAKNPAHLQAAITLSHLLRNQGRYGAVASVVKSLVAAIPIDRVFAAKAIVFLRDCQQHASAEQIWQSMPNGSDAEWNYIGGEIAMALGDFNAACARFDRCLAIDPTHAAAIIRRATACPIEMSDEYAHHLRILSARRHELPPQSAIAIDFAIGKFAMELGDYQQAFEHLDRGNREQHELTPWHDSMPKPAQFPPHTAADKSGNEIVFVIGMPRSGTTLLASRLANSPQVADRGELPWLGMIGRSMIGEAQYVSHLRRDDASVLRYIDKNPLNFMHLDTMVRVFPNACVLNCVRDPRDVAISCYMQFFAHPDMSWSYSWSDILRFQKRNHEFLAKRPPHLRWLDIDYADLVTNPSPTLRRAFDFLELSWHSDSPGAAASRPISTASVWQARQPLHTRSIGRWRHCAAYVKPLIDAYGKDELPSAIE